MKFLKATVFGGVVFLLPLVLVLVILTHALRLAEKATQPISKLLPDAVVGIGGITVLAALALIAVSFVAGLIARTTTGKRIGQRMEVSLLSGIPQYQFVKSMAEGLAQVSGNSGIEPALISIEGGWQVGYLLEILEDGWVAVFLPQAPTPMSGNIMYLPAGRVRPLGITMVQAMAIIKRMGVGSGAALRGTDLTLPLGA